MTDGMKITELFDLSHTQASEYLRGFEFPWEALGGIKDFVLAYGSTLSPDEYDHPQEDVWQANLPSKRSRPLGL